MAGSNTNLYKDLNRLLAKKQQGSIIDALDEQRLRDHQIRQLRRLWLKDQIVSSREPLLPPKKMNIYQRLRVQEENFWSRVLKFRTVGEYLQHGKGFGQMPLLMLYKFQGLLRTFYGFIVLPTIPLVYWLKYSTQFEAPGMWYGSIQPTYPGDKQITGKLGELQFDPLKYSYVDHNEKK